MTSQTSRAVPPVDGWPYGDPLAMVRHALRVQIPGRTAASKVLAFLAVSADDCGESWHGIASITAGCGLTNQRRTHEALAVLVEAGWIVREQRPHRTAATTRLATPALSRTPAASRTRSTNEVPLQAGTSRERARGRRWGDDEQVPEEWRLEVMDRLSLDRATVDMQADQFGDYWRAKTGAAATKRDWPATWRNWCRRAVTDFGAAAGRPSNHSRSDDFLATMRGIHGEGTP